MSQYPSPPPYSPPPQQPGYGYDFSYYQPQQDPLAPARRASIMMFVLGGLMALFGACNLISSLVMPADQVLAQQESLLGGQPSPMSAEAIQALSAFMAISVCVVGVTIIVLGVSVRRGGMGAVVGAIIVSSIVTLFLLLILVIAIIGAATISPLYGGFACVVCLPLLPFVVLLSWLVQAARAAPRIAMMKSQYQQQLWQYQQQQQMYQAGYLAPPAPQSSPPAYQQPTPTVPPPAPSSPDDPSKGDPYGPAT
ncbi:MAG: hypothetical protein WBD40_19990 [Tepidisphaeraceae bacterium]